MKRGLLLMLFVASVTLAAAGGYVAGTHGFIVPALAAFKKTATTAADAAAPSGPVIYYRHPDGEPAYSSGPRRTQDGRDFVPVHASEDVSFDAEEPGKAETANASDQGRRILYYRNPMGLPDTSPVPKKDPMGMDYVPVYEGGTGDGSTVKIPNGRLQRTGVKTALVRRDVVVRKVRVPGTIALDERNISIVSLRTEAFIEKVADVTTGQPIAKGQPLVTFYSREITTAGAQYVADLAAGARPGAIGGSRQRLQNLGAPAGAITEIERTGKVPLSMTLAAPRDGVILQRVATDGMMASPGEPLFRIADISTVWITADVPEYELGAVRLGAETSISVRSLPGRTFRGRVNLIYPEMDEKTRTTRVRIELPNLEGLLLANMYADVEIATGAAEPVIVVPESAVIDTGERQFVIVDKGNGRFEPRNVKLGKRGQDLTEIREGIAEGERVVVAGNFLIDAESNLNSALNALSSGDSKP